LKIFGNDFYFEIQLNELDIQERLNKFILELSEQYKRKIIVTGDTHYMKEKDWQIHDVLICKTYKTKLGEPNNGNYTTHELWVKNYNDLEQDRKEYHKYISKKQLQKYVKNTEEIAKLIQSYPLIPKTNPLPKFGEGDSMDTLIELCKKGFKTRLTSKQKKSKVYKERLKEELKVIRKIGYPDYFLLVWDIVRNCRKDDIAVGPGRGSVCGSLVAFLLDITQIDPVRFNIIFERFLNEDRISMPDIDMDFSKQRRDDVLKILEKLYGAEKLAQIVSYGKWKPRGVIKDTARVLGYDFMNINSVTKLIDDKTEEWKKIPKEVKQFLKKDKKLRNRSKRLMGTINYKGLHASGVAITPSDMSEWIPVAYLKDRNKKDAKMREKITEWDMYALEDLNLLKFDRLGLTTLDIIHQTVKLVNKIYGKNTIENIDKICLDDLENNNIYQLIRDQELQGLFQIEKSQGMARLISDLKPKVFYDIILIISLFRTAVLEAGMHTEYIKRRILVENDKADKIKIIHPMLKEILNETFGVLVFQEQVMSIGHKMGNMTLRESDNFRKAIKLKDPKKFKVWQEKFLKGAEKNGVKKKIANKVWDWMYKFAGYGFNFAHGTAYAFLTYQTAWLKYHYRKEFMACVMSECQKGDDAKRKLPKCITESRKYFKVECPSINYSTKRFEIFKDDLLFPLSAIKTVGEKAVDKIIEVRKKKGFKSFEDFYETVNKRTVNVGVISNIILSDAFRDFGTKEEMFDEFMSLRKKDKVSRQLYCYDCKYRYPCTVKESDSPICPSCDSGSVTIDIDECTNKKFNNSFCENNYVFGFNVKENPLRKYSKYALKYNYLDFDEAIDLSPGNIAKVIVIVSNIKKHIDKREREMAFVNINDINNEEADLCIFSSDWQDIKKVLKIGGIYKMRLVKNKSSSFNQQEKKNNFLYNKYDKSFIKKLN